MDIVIATRNPDKFAELTTLLHGLKCRWRSARDFPDLPEVVEDGDSYDANAEKKAVTVAAATGCLAVADDSGLEVDALDGEPGIHTARYAGPEATYEDNIRKLLTALQGIPERRRNAVFHCSIAMADPSGLIKVVRGELHGRIALSARGQTGFGYDPVFFIPKYDKTLAELGPRIKHHISHRAHAARLAKRLLQRRLAARATTRAHRLTSASGS